MAVPIITVAQMRQWEQATWDSGQSVETVMRLAGCAVADKAVRLTRPGQPILVLAGKGNNGGDAKFAAEAITDRPVQLIDAADPVAALSRLRAALDENAPSNALAIDGLFGIGLNRPLNEDWQALITALNQSGLRVLSVDVPSGLNADSGQSMGAVVEAEATVTFGAPKAGMLKPDAIPFVGQLEVANNIGLAPCPFTAEAKEPIWTEARDFKGFPPPRPAHGHKGTFGHLAILAGSQGFHGAAVIAARAAHRAMPGLVSLFTTAPAWPAVAAQLSQSMVHPCPGSAALPSGATAILAGPGLAGPDVPPALREQIRDLWASAPLPMLVDASALDFLAPGDDPPGLRVLTPHPGEAARLLETTSSEIQRDRLGAAKNISRRFGNCHVVLKGAQTVVFGPGAPPAFNSTGNPTLGQGGSGDALAGYLAGLLAQPLLLGAGADRLIRFAVWEHGRVADRLSESTLAWDLEDFIPRLGNSRLNP